MIERVCFEGDNSGVRQNLSGLERGGPVIRSDLKEELRADFRLDGQKLSAQRLSGFRATGMVDATKQAR